MPVPPVTSRASARGAGTQQRQRPRPEPRGQPLPRSAAAGRDAPRPARRRPRSAAARARRRGPSPRTRARRRRRENGSAASPYSVSVGIATTPPSRIHLAASSIASRCGASGIDEHTAHRHYHAAWHWHPRTSVVRHRLLHRRPRAAPSSRGRRRRRSGCEAPPTKPAMNGLLAMPTSDALVSTPKPAPCAPGGITAPAAL